MHLTSAQTDLAPLAGQLDLTPLAGHALHLDQYLGPWAIEETRGLALLQHVQALDLSAHVQSHANDRFDQTQSRTIAAADGQSSPGTAGAVALISLEGAMLKRPSSLSPGASTVRARHLIRMAAADPDIGAIVIRFDSPGGTVSGTHDLAADVRAASQRKPVIGFIEDLGASAAYLVASQCDVIYANEPGALVGSIGVLWGLYDLSARAAMQGVKPVLITSGGLKGTGFEGTAITAEQQQYLQSLVDDANQQFVQAVVTGRKKSVDTVRQWNTGRVWPASIAQQMGLIDGIQSLDATLAAASRAAHSRRSTNRKAEIMPSSSATITTIQGESLTATTTAAPQPATFQQIVAACSGLKASEAEDAMFVTQQLAQNATAAQATANWMQTLVARTGAARQEVETSRQTKPAATPGVDPLVSGSATGATGGNSVAEDFWASVAAKEKAGKTREQALSSTVREDPARHAAMLAEHNADRAKPRRA